MKDPAGPSAVDDHRAGAGAHNREVRRDVQVTDGGVEAHRRLRAGRDAERVRARGEIDRIVTGVGVRLLNRRSQRAGVASGRADPVAGTRVHGVGGAVHGERVSVGGSQRCEHNRDADLEGAHGPLFMQG